MAYAEQLEREMKKFYDSLSEKDRRRYAAVEVAKLGHGGIEYIARVFGCDAKTIWHGRQDLETLPTETRERIRKKGGTEAVYREPAGVGGQFFAGAAG